MSDLTIGIVDQGREEKLRLYAEAVAAAGARFEVLPWTGDAERDAQRFDGLVLCGGDDVDAARWGEANHPTVELVPAVRDDYEIRLVRRALAHRTPLLGVCRGSQVMNVALGGTLIQHVPEVPGAGAHQGGARHEVALVPGTLLASLSHAAAAQVNSHHHQAIGRVAEGLRVAARAPDGIVEAVEAGDGGPDGGRFVVGVQWHPEREGNDAPYGLDLFAELVRAAGAARTARNPGT
jgi:putative glutamine amidotransferase